MFLRCGTQVRGFELSAVRCMVLATQRVSSPTNVAEDDAKRRESQDKQVEAAGLAALQAGRCGCIRRPWLGSGGRAVVGRAETATAVVVAAQWRRQRRPPPSSSAEILYAGIAFTRDKGM